MNRIEIYQIKVYKYEPTRPTEGPSSYRLPLATAYARTVQEKDDLFAYFKPSTGYEITSHPVQALEDPSGQFWIATGVGQLDIAQTTKGPDILFAIAMGKLSKLEETTVIGQIQRTYKRLREEVASNDKLYGRRVLVCDDDKQTLSRARIAFPDFLVITPTGCPGQGSGPRIEVLILATQKSDRALLDSLLPHCQPNCKVVFVSNMIDVPKGES